VTAGGRLRLLIWDACVLIDFYEADPALFRLIADHVGEVHVPLPVLAEVKQLDESVAASLGITVDDLPGEVLLEAAARRGGLSFEDRICLVAAAKNGWTCVTNDKALKNACADAKVQTLWGFEVLALLVEGGGLPADDARDLAKGMYERNRRLGAAVLQRFYRRIGLSVD
jgi:predicted nucleic acid-binding protein